MNLVKVQRLLKGVFGDRLGRDVLMLSITLDADVDTPQVLKEYAELNGVQPGWLYLTGSHDEIESLRYSMGVYDRDPIIDADKTQHGNLLTFGNDRNDRWAALPALMKPGQIVAAVLRLTHEWKRPQSPTNKPQTQTKSKT